MNHRWLYQQYEPGCNTTIILALINQANSKRKQYWRNWVGGVCIFNQSYWSYWLSLYWLMQSILLIVSIVSIVLIVAFSISVRCNWRIVLMTQQILGQTFGVKRENISRLMEFTGICKDFRRSVWEINKIPLGVMISNYPLGKMFTLQNIWGSNIFRR